MSLLAPIAAPASRGLRPHHSRNHTSAQEHKSPIVQVRKYASAKLTASQLSHPRIHDVTILPPRPLILNRRHLCLSTHQHSAAQHLRIPAPSYTVQPCPRPPCPCILVPRTPMPSRYHTLCPFTPVHLSLCSPRYLLRLKSRQATQTKTRPLPHLHFVLLLNSRTVLEVKPNKYSSHILKRVL